MSRFLVVSDIRFLYAESAKLQPNLRICNINKIQTKCIENMWIRYTYDISNRKHIVSCLRFIRDFDDREHRFGQLEIVARSVVRYGSCQSNQNWSKLFNHINKIYGHVCMYVMYVNRDLHRCTQNHLIIGTYTPHASIGQYIPHYVCAKLRRSSNKDLHFVYIDSILMFIWLWAVGLLIWVPLMNGQIIALIRQKNTYNTAIVFAHRMSIDPIPMVFDSQRWFAAGGQRLNFFLFNDMLTN